MIFTSKQSQRGSIIIFSVLILTTMILISTSLLNIFLPKLKVVYNSGNSIVAVFVADSGVEKCLYEARHQTLPSPILSNPLTSGAFFAIASLSATEVPVTSDCRPLGTGSFRFRSVGSFRGINRALEVYQ